ncbi:hypothetical protein E2C01_098164 [Portunus trituberculatus]|uniref:Uncharacterized protein n=1 Tax=Portunus trituberculatus TaxID=210409 RepID=A0A5B7K2A6_PORTR|nr:hypothetical protein [Portunus trituberculatus]
MGRSLRSPSRASASSLYSFLLPPPLPQSPCLPVSLPPFSPPPPPCLPPRSPTQAGGCQASAPTLPPASASE